MTHVLVKEKEGFLESFDVVLEQDVRKVAQKQAVANSD